MIKLLLTLISFVCTSFCQAQIKSENKFSNQLLFDVTGICIPSSQLSDNFVWFIPTTESNLDSLFFKIDTVRFFNLFSNRISFNRYFDTVGNDELQLIKISNSVMDNFDRLIPYYFCKVTLEIDLDRFLVKTEFSRYEIDGYYSFQKIKRKTMVNLLREPAWINVVQFSVL